MMSWNSRFGLPNLALRLCLALLVFYACHKTGMLSASGPSPAWGMEYKIPSAALQTVSFDSLDRNAETGKPVVIRALLFRPVFADSRRLPAVVALHGCSGMYSTAKSKRDALTNHYRAIADMLVAEGYAVLFPDSFRSRGFEEICTVDLRKKPVLPRHRLKDAQGALAWLQRRDDILPDRVAVLGWSHGGITALATLNAKDPTVAAWRDRNPPSPYFRAGAAFYPGCADSLKARNGYSLAAPLSFFIGGSDDWTAPGPCVDLAAKLSAAGEDATIAVYPDAHHGFDAPTTELRHRIVPGGVNPGKGVTVGGNPAARDDAYAKLKKYLHERLGP